MFHKSGEIPNISSVFTQFNGQDTNLNYKKCDIRSKVLKLKGLQAMSGSKYKQEISKAVRTFWRTRKAQADEQIKRKVKDQGSRGAVTGGQQMNGFIELLREIAIANGVPNTCIYVKRNKLPGFFRPSKDWDFIIVSPKKHLLVAIELKSHVGSFGNNFNNRTEEALGSATDLWTAYRENAFPNQQPPWVGYMMVVERSRKSTQPVKIGVSHFKAFKEFENSSYLDRYKLFCQKLMQEKHYTSTALLWTSSDNTFGSLAEETSMDVYLNGFIGYLKGKANEFKP